MSTALDDYAGKLGRQLAQAKESSIRRLVRRNIHPCPSDAVEVMQEIEKRGWTMSVVSHPDREEAVIYDGPSPEIGEMMDESKVIDREPLPSIQLKRERKWTEYRSGDY